MSALPPSVPLPRGLPQWIPFLWCRVLFPVVPPLPANIRWGSLALVIVLPALLLYPTRSFLLLEPDEGRYAEIAREMLQRGEWVVPSLDSQPYLDKPPLLYWLVEISYTLFGVHEASARLVPALAIHLTILLVYLLGRRSVGERGAFWAAMLLSIAPGFLAVGRLLILDGLLTLWSTLAILAAFEALRGDRLRWSWWLLSAVACGLGVLTKGPVVLLLLAPPLIAQRWLTGQPVRAAIAGIGAFLAVVLLVNLPWYLAIYLRQPAFLRYFFWEHNVLRFLKPFDHLQPVWYYGPILLGGLMPGTLLLIPFLRHLLAGTEPIGTGGRPSCLPLDGMADRNVCPMLAGRTVMMGFWLLAGGWCVLFFSLSGSKLPTYILPAYPSICLALGAYMANSRWDGSIYTRIGLATTACLMAALLYVGVPWYARQRSPFGEPGKVEPYFAQKETVICFPRNVDSIAFYMNRDDLRSVRTKASQDLIVDCLSRPRTVVLFTHRHSLETLKVVLPPQLRIKQATTLRDPPATGSTNSAATNPGGCAMSLWSSGRNEANSCEWNRWDSTQLWADKISYITA